MPKPTTSTRGPICPYCQHRHVETTAWGAGDYSSKCQGCDQWYDLTIRVTRTYVTQESDDAK